ncbi:MAG: enoyl-CoA hydratase-related protein [Actinomycetota bacterium]|nr:enoyl-CoA hydratase-related protein [Actinomycetota bacterium]
MGYDAIRVERDGATVHVTLANPDRRNVLSLTTMRELIAAFGEVGGSDALGVILAGEGPAFSAGHNFGDMAGADFATARALFDVCTEMMTLVQEIPQVVVAEVAGIATAAGCQLVASCDLAVAAESATFAAPGGKGGLFCHTPMVAISRSVGRKRALEMALTGDSIDARTAADWGLVNRVVPDDELHAATVDLLGRATRGSAYAKGVGKRTFYAQLERPQAEAYELASAVMSAGVTTADGQEGITSFLEKRRPKWLNR